MAANADQCAALQRDSNFQARVLAIALQYAALVVYGEAGSVPNHPLRLAFARAVLNGGGSNLPQVLANSTNVIASNVTYDFTDGHVKTDATDAALSSQIATDWDMLSGV